MDAVTVVCSFRDYAEVSHLSLHRIRAGEASRNASRARAASATARRPPTEAFAAQLTQAGDPCAQKCPSARLFAPSTKRRCSYDDSKKSQGSSHTVNASDGPPYGCLLEWLQI
jgi:hypothetical protein